MPAASGTLIPADIGCDTTNLVAYQIGPCGIAFGQSVFWPTPCWPEEGGPAQGAVATGCSRGALRRGWVVLTGHATAEARTKRRKANLGAMRLYLLRHARAEIGGNEMPDHVRGLTAEGRREAAGVGSWLAGRSEPPAHVLCSSAARAVETMECVLAALPEKPATSVSDDLYLVSAGKLLEQIRATESGVSSLMLVGHNPGLAELAAKLSAQGDPAALRSLARRFPPGTLAEVELGGSSWGDLDPDAGKLVSHFVA